MPVVEKAPISGPTPEEMATAVAASLRQREDVLAVVLMGSVARGDAIPSSDIDILAITSSGARPTELLSAVKESCPADRLSLVAESQAHFASLCEQGALFALHVRTEGRTLFERDRWLLNQLTRTRDIQPNPELTFRWAEAELRHYEHLERFNGIFLFVLARMYSIGRAVAIGLTVTDGTPVFGKDRPFLTAARTRPPLRVELERVAALRPFHERVAGKPRSVLPFDHRGADHPVQQAHSDITHLLRAARE
jgi:Polymerase beta, Nucleotidyltransferase